MVFASTTSTFREFDRRVDEVARGLLALGTQRGDVVSVLAGNRPEWLVAAFAALRIGACMAPMNTWYKAAEMAYQLQHASVKTLFMVPGLLKQDYTTILPEIIPELAGPVDGELHSAAFPELRHVVALSAPALPGAIGLDEVVKRGTAVSDDDFRAAEAAVDGSDLAFILYTSGSTARPKGVRLLHAPLLANDFQIGERQHLTPEDRVWLAIPLFYGLAAVNAMPAVWTHGGCLVLQETFDAGEALQLIEEERATVYYGLGNMTRALVDHPSRPQRDLSSLQKGLAGLSPEDKRLAIQDLGVSRCCSMYGATENYGNCAVTDADDPPEVKLHTQGHPLSGWEFRIVDPATEAQLGTGEIGELRVKGYMTPGYHGDEEATRRAFDEDGFFRTGDLAMLDSDGRMRFHSRLKDMLKVGGINVSPREVEEILESHPDVRQAYVVGIPDETRGEEVCAFVEPASESLNEAELRAFVKERAAAFKVPRFIFFRADSEFPRLASGKVPKYELIKEALRELQLHSNAT